MISVTYLNYFLQFFNYKLFIECTISNMVNLAKANQVIVNLAMVNQVMVNLPMANQVMVNQAMVN